MINLMTSSTLTDRPVVAASPLGVSLRGSGLLACSASLPVLPVRERSERPTMAPAVAAKSEARVAYAFAAANGAGTAKGAFAGNGAITAITTVARIEQQQKKTQHGMWAFRGPEPWSDPA